jgi:hypothetical protein
MTEQVLGVLVVGTVQHQQGTHGQVGTSSNPPGNVLLFHGLAIVHQSAVRQAPTQGASAGGWGIWSHGVAEL